MIYWWRQVGYIEYSKHIDDFIVYVMVFVQTCICVLYVDIYVSIHIDMYLYIHIHIYIYMYIYIHQYMFVYIYICLHYIHIIIYIYICIHNLFLWVCIHLNISLIYPEDLPLDQPWFLFPVQRQEDQQVGSLGVRSLWGPGDWGSPRVVFHGGFETGKIIEDLGIVKLATGRVDLVDLVYIYTIDV